MRAPLVRYRSLVADSARWDGFAFRDGDIVISAPIKCGTTWVQMICALLIFQQRAFGTSLDLISPWLDMVIRPLSNVVHDLDAQQHRRFVKSHTPLDGLPFDARVTYICIGRDPRDAAASFDNHMANLDVDAFIAALHSATDNDIFTEATPTAPRFRAASQRDRFREWIDAPASPGLRALVHHLTTFWEARGCANVVLLHYNDLKIDLDGQMRRLATRLGINVSEELWPELVQAATFEEMRKRADEIVPNSTAALWYDNERFFNKGTCGQWQQLLEPADLYLYESRVKELANPDLAAWMHQGRIL
jgi:hypothetical protein